MLAHFAIESVRDFMRVAFSAQLAPNQPEDDKAHLGAAITFLMRSIEASKGRASSKAYRFGRGWLPPYRETSGYIIPTLLDLSEHLNRPDLGITAERIGEWLAEVQEPDGGFIERDLHDVKPVVFNTGQILHGFNALISRRGRKDLLFNARRAGDFIVASADATGSFVRNEHHDIAHAYNVRSAWALLTLSRLLDDDKYEKTALSNADWTIAQQKGNGFFCSNVFQPGLNSNTHGIAYVLQGLIEIYCLCRREPYLAAVRRSVDYIVSLLENERHLVSEIGEDWEFRSKHLCLTGYAQLAIVLFRLYGLGGDKKYLDTGVRLVDAVAATQDLTSPDKPHYGGIKGSFPIYGRYAPLQYPNWATKFFIDALLAKHLALSAPKSNDIVELLAG